MFMKQVILITGGSSGIGRATAERLSKRHEVVILARDEEGLQGIADEIGCTAMRCDVTKYDEIANAVRETIKRFGRVDVLINNAGLWIQGKLEDNDPDRIQEVIAVNTLGPIFCSHAVIPQMKKQESGLIINVISQAGLYTKAERSVYNASKWAMTGFTKSLLDDLLPYGIRVSGLYPGVIRTELFKHGGVDRDLTHTLDPEQVAKTIEYVVEAGAEVCIPEIGLRSLDA